VTGGESFEPRVAADIVDTLTRIARDIRHTYTIGYIPADSVRDSRYRRIRVRVTGADGREYRVRAREGYMLEDESGLR
jgi:hypothetical protein